MDKKKLLLICLIILNFANTKSFSKINFVEEKSLNKIQNIHQKEDFVAKKNIQNVQFLLKNTFLALVESLDLEKTNNNENLNAAEIQSDTQLNDKNFVKAEGNVLVKYRNMILKADKLEYNRKNKTISNDRNW